MDPALYAKVDPTFWCVPIEVVAKAKDAIQMPSYSGSALRGVLGMSLLKMFCVLKQVKCSECPLRASCLYVYLFETDLGKVIDGISRAPHPFVLDLDFNPESKGNVIEKGSLFSFKMKLIGQGSIYLPHFVNAFNIMGGIGLGRGRGTFEVERIFSGGDLVYDGSKLKWPEHALKWRDAIDQAQFFSSDNISITFTSPLRIMFRKELSKVPEFHILIGNLLQRFTNLCRFHCNGEDPALGKDLIVRAREVKLYRSDVKWIDWERYSHRQRKKMKLGGLIGSVIYKGDLKEFMPLLIVGSWIHAGKNTSFGLGNYRIDS